MSKPMCNKELTAQAVRLKKQGMSNKDIIAQLCIGESTFYKWMNTPKNDAEVEFGESLKAAEAEFKTALRQRIIRAADGGAWQAAAWMLERQYPDEYGRKFVDAKITGQLGVKGIDPQARAEMDKLLGLNE